MVIEQWRKYSAYSLDIHRRQRPCVLSLYRSAAHESSHETVYSFSHYAAKRRYNDSLTQKSASLLCLYSSNSAARQWPHSRCSTMSTEWFKQCLRSLMGCFALIVPFS